MMGMEAELTNDYLVKRMLRSYIGVTILVTIAATVSIMINGLIVGNLMNADAISAYGFANPMLILLSAVAGILANGGTIGCSYYMGRKDYDAIGRNFTTVMVSSVIIGILYCIACVVFADPLAGLFGADGIVHTYT